LLGATDDAKGNVRKAVRDGEDQDDGHRRAQIKWQIARQHRVAQRLVNTRTQRCYQGGEDVQVAEVVPTGSYSRWWAVLRQTPVSSFVTAFIGASRAPSKLGPSATA
jgi:hypothetical protein